MKHNLTADANMYISIVIIILHTLCAIPPIGGEMYTSVHELSNWSNLKKNLLSTIESYMQLERARLDRLQSIKSSLITPIEQEDENNSSKSFSNTDEYDQSVEQKIMINPISAFTSLHYITRVISDIDTLYEDAEPNLRTQLQSLIADAKLPSREDFIGSGKALLRLQAFYELKTESLVKGQFRTGDDELDKQLAIHHNGFGDLRMDALDCFELGKIAYESNNFISSMDWFQISLELVDQEYFGLENIQTSITKRSRAFYIELLDYLAFSAYKVGQVEYAAQLTELWLVREPENERARNNLDYYKHILEYNQTQSIDSEQSNDSKHHLDSSGEANHSLDRYQPGNSVSPADYELADDLVIKNLCKRSNNQRSRREKCFKKFQFIDYQLSPELKIEVLHEEPRVFRIFDVISEEEAAHLLRSALPKLQRSTIQAGSGIATTDFRIAKTAWLSKTLDPFIERIGKRISEMLRLDLSDSEDLQVVNYGLGGYYGPHLDAARTTMARDNDSLPISSLKQNDRMATILIYLNNVEIGGATVFPRIGLTVQPIERSAVVWYNLQRSGIADEKTIHSGCPVLLGSKWIATLWPRERANSFLRPCGLERDDR